ncbi:MAG: dihydroorotase [Bacteroidota bacterium]|nr:dihydroorotase [Bacteroidota bacterium]
MQSYLLKNINIVDEQSEFNGQTGDLLIENGVVKLFEIDHSLQNADQIIDFTGCFATPSFIDVRCNSSEPGFEHRETYETLNKTALYGGYSQIALLPNCFPNRNSKTEVNYVINQSKQFPVQFLPLGTITQDMKGEDLSEMFDMLSAGAVAFSNGNYAIENSGTMSKAILYSKNFDGLIYSFCHLSELAKGAYVNEGTVALSLGLKGIPQMAEYLQVQRDIELADYHQHKIHISKVSTERSVEIIRQAKLQGIKVTCDVAVMNLVLTDEALMEFDSHLKLMPPLRQANDVKALWEGIADGTIDAICSDHHPQEIEKKNVELEYAAYGASTLQIALSLAVEGRNRFKPLLSDNILFSKFNVGPANVLGLNYSSIQIDKPVSISIINPHQQTMLNTKNNQSLSQNSYYIGKPLPYFVEAIFNHQFTHFNP